MRQIRITRRRGSGGTSQRGAAAVEMAIVLPLLLLLVFGIVEFGLIFNRWITVTHSAREGVRQLALGKPDADAIALAEAAAPDLTGDDEVTCTASAPALGQVQMTCNTNYDLSLFIHTTVVPLHSSARMSRE
ncbi:MAG: pilus assembly protein [Actinobacteria bacterium]|nr:pilus assembly protein [Actinomycetota bacterium]